MLKTAIATAILGLGIAGAYFTIQNPIIEPGSGLKNGNNNLPKNSPFVESLNHSSTPGTSLESTAQGIFSTGGNLTDEFINGLKQDVAENNLDNSSNNLVLSDPNQIAGDLLKDAMIKFESERSKSIVDEAKIKISNDNSKSSILAYVNIFQAIILETTKRVKMNNISDEPDPKDLIPLLSGYDFSIQKFYNTTVPSSVLVFHKKEIELLSRKKRALEELINYESDPVSSILASQELAKIQEEFDTLTENFNKFLEKI